MKYFNYTTKIILELLNARLQDLIDFISENCNGFLDLQRGLECDPVYGCMYNNNFELEECRIYALKIQHGNLYCYAEFLNAGIAKVIFDLPEDSENWYPISSGDIAYVHTMFNILEVIEEYLND